MKFKINPFYYHDTTIYELYLVDGRKSFGLVNSIIKYPEIQPDEFEKLASQSKITTDGYNILASNNKKSINDLIENLQPWILMKKLNARNTVEEI